MEFLIIIGIAIASWWGISALNKNLGEGKKASDELKKARSELFSLRRECDSMKNDHKDELHSIRRYPFIEAWRQEKNYILIVLPVWHLSYLHLKFRYSITPQVQLQVFRQAPHPIFLDISSAA